MLQLSSQSKRIDISIYRDTNTLATHVRVDGNGVSLESFSGKYFDALANIFGERIVTKREEVEELSAFFSRDTATKTYKRGAMTMEKVKKTLERDASRSFQGNVFTGYAVVERKSNTIIGRATLGEGYVNGESQSGLILNEAHRGQGYGKETTHLMAALALVFFQNQYEVMDAPVHSFTGTALVTNTDTINAMQRGGLKYMRNLSLDENYDERPRVLYGIKDKEIEPTLKKYLGDTQVALRIFALTSKIILHSQEQCEKKKS